MPDAGLATNGIRNGIEPIRSAPAGLEGPAGMKSSIDFEPWFAPASPRSPGRAAVIGAGIAGASVTHALRRRGWNVTLIDRHGAIAEEASGNPVGVIMPRVTADDG